MVDRPVVVGALIVLSANEDSRCKDTSTLNVLGRWKGWDSSNHSWWQTYIQRVKSVITES